MDYRLSFELPTIGDSDSRAKFLEQHGKLVEALHSHYLEEEFIKCAGKSPIIDLSAKLKILSAMNKSFIALSAETNETAKNTENSNTKILDNELEFKFRTLNNRFVLLHVNPIINPKTV